MHDDRRVERPARPSRSPIPLLATGLIATLVMILAFCLYTVREVRALRDEQMRISERNRLDSLQLLRIQNNLSTLATQMRDMADRTEPYPMTSWRQTFDRLKSDLKQALAAERSLAPAERPAAQQQQLEASIDRFWSTIDRAFDQAEGDEARAAATLRTTATTQHQQLVGLVSQFLVLNNRVQEDASRMNEAIYGRVVREIFILMSGLLLLVGATGAYGITTTRWAFDDVRRLSRQLRSLSWRMMRLQEELQENFSRELHDEFGQLLTAIGMLLGRVKRNLPGGSLLIADLEEVQGIVQQTLDRIRTESRLLHPVILDDFGLENALKWYVEQFGRQHGIDARFQKSGPIGVIPSDATIHIYRIVQEALTNVSRHSGSPQAWVRLRQEHDWIQLEIEDCGCGLRPKTDGAKEGAVRSDQPSSVGSRSRPDQAALLAGPLRGPAGRSAEASAQADAEAGGGQGIGLISMRERTELMGGEFALRPRPGGGLIVSVRVPLRSGAPAAAVEDDREEASIG